MNHPLNQDFYSNDNNHHELYLHGSMNTTEGHDHNNTFYASNNNVNTVITTSTSSNNNNVSDDDTPKSAPIDSGNPITNFFSKSGHPITCIFHLLFKVAAILIYLMGGVFEKSTNFVTVTVLCVISLSMDFWTVKNITGRLLVGLRWWANNEEVKPLVTTTFAYAQQQQQQQPQLQTQYPISSTTTKWIFESKPNFTPNAFDQWWFWTVLYVNSIIWIVFFFSSLLKWNFGWLLVDGLGIALAFANVYGYWQCSKEQKMKFDNVLKRQLEKGVTAAAAAGANYSFGSSGMMAVGSWMNSVWNQGEGGTKTATASTGGIGIGSSTANAATQPTHSFV